MRVLAQTFGKKWSKQKKEKGWTFLISGVEYGTFRSLVKFALKVAKPAHFHLLPSVKAHKVMIILETDSNQASLQIECFKIFNVKCFKAAEFSSCKVVFQLYSQR